jgi:hypothetical protein
LGIGSFFDNDRWELALRKPAADSMFPMSDGDPAGRPTIQFIVPTRTRPSGFFFVQISFSSDKATDPRAGGSGSAGACKDKTVP